MGVLFPKVRDVWSGLTGVRWFGLSILVHFGSGLAYGVKESCGGVKFGVGSKVKGCGIFPFWLRFFE